MTEHNSDDPEVVMPTSLLLTIFNSLPKENLEPRSLVIEYLRSYKEKVQEKGHVAEGFRLLPDGTLIFEASLYDEAVYRGKIQTYTRILHKGIEKLKSEVEILRLFGEDHQKALAVISTESLEQRIGEGREISKEEALLLQKIMPVLLSLSEPSGGE